MKFIKEITPKGLLLPVTAARLAGFNAGDKVEYHTLDGAMLVLKGRMSAPELLAVVQQLTSTSAQLLHYLSEVCGPCEDCDKDSCPYNDFEEEAVQVNEYLREAAGIPDGAKLCAEVDEEAHTITVLAAEHRYDLRDLPAALLESFIGQARDAYQALGLFGLEHCAGNPLEQDYKGKVLVMRPDTLRESCWDPRNMLWLAEGGFGCSPHARGQAVYATCLGDGEKTRWNRSDFSGVLDEQYLPDWAREKLEELRTPQQEQDTGPAMGGMTME